MKLFDYTLKNRAEVIIASYKLLISERSRILDIGCGKGIISEMIGKHFNCKVVGTDIMDYRTTNIDFLLIEDNGNLPFTDKEFDIVMFNDVLHHIPYNIQEKILMEGIRVGKKVLIFELEPSLYAKISDWIANKMHNPNVAVTLTQRKLDEWETLFDKHDLEYRHFIIKRDFPTKFLPFSYKKLAELLYYPITNYCFVLTRKLEIL